MRKFGPAAVPGHETAQARDNGDMRAASARWGGRSVAGLAFAALVFAAAFTLYAATLQPDVQPADSGELQIAAATLTIPHPPGYPLYTLLGWLATRLPIAPMPYAGLSLLSAFTSALGVAGLAAMAAAGGTGAWLRRAAATGAAAALATSVTFWAQATTANIRSLTALFAIALAAAAVAADAARSEQDWRTRRAMGASASPRFTAARRALLGFALALGFGVGHHLSLVFAAAPLGLFVLGAYLRARATSRDRLIGLLASVGLAAAGQTLWLLLPLRNAAAGPLDHADLSTLQGFVDHALARGFEGDFFYFVAREPQRLGDRLALLPQLLLFQFSPAALAVLAAGWTALLIRRRALGLSLLASVAVHMFVTLVYRAPQTVEYALPAWAILAAGAGLGLAALTRLPRLPDADRPRPGPRGPGLAARERGSAPSAETPWARARRALPAVGLGLSLTLAATAVIDGVSRSPSFAALAADRSARQRAEAALTVAAPGDVVLAQWHEATPLWAIQNLDGIRPDVAVRYVYPAGAEAYEDTFARRAAEGAPLALTVFGPSFARRGLCPDPVGPVPVWRIQPCDSRAAPTGAPIAVFDQRIEVLGLEAGGDWRPGGVGLIRIAWRARPVPGDALTVRVLYPDGRLAANTDIGLDGFTTAGEIHSQLLALGLPLDLPTGPIHARVGAYRSAGGAISPYSSANGEAFPALAQTTVAPATLPNATTRPLRWPPDCRIASRAELISVDYDLGVPNRMRVYLGWSSPATATVTLRSPVAAPAGQTLAAGGCAILIFDTAPANGLAVDVDGRTLALPDPRPGERFVPYAGGIALTGARIARRGSETAVTVDWLAGHPPGSDVKVSARLRGERAFGQHDGTPGLGALPTLKWMAGSRIADTHLIPLDGSASALSGDVLLYDNFTQLPLPALDLRYDQAGLPLIREDHRP